MRPVTLAEIVAWTGGTTRHVEVVVDALDTDSRSVPPGALFVALRGERADGHDFLGAAAARGAAAALVEREVIGTPLPQVLVDDAVAALGLIAAALREEHRSVVLALTGSNGKTTVKTLLHGILSRVAPSYANAGNRNNELGMPLALIDEPADCRYAIYEMGAGQPGDIAYLADIARPQVALVNNIGPAHLERMGSLLGIARTKGAIYEALPADGVAVVNADDAFGAWFAQAAGRRRVLRFGLSADADVVARDVQVGVDASRFRLLTPVGEAAVALPLAGRHNVGNALAAAAMALAVDAPLAQIVAGLEGAEPVAGRLTRYRLASGAELIDDSYNANPASLVAAIDTLAAGGGRTCLVLGDMRELGPDAASLHADVGARAKTAGIDSLWTVGELSAHAARAFGEGAQAFADQAALAAALAPRLGAGVRCLVKGSRGSRMERVVAALRDAATEDSHAA